MTDREIELLEQDRKALRRKIFGAPYIRPDQEFGHLRVRRASDIPVKAIPVPAADDPLLIAARKAFPASLDSQYALIVHRYRNRYDGIPEADAVRAILKGYSSPAHAMQARQLKRRPLKGGSS